MSTLCTVLNSNTDKGVLVSLHLGSPPNAVGETSLLDLVTFLSVSEHSSAVGEKGTDDIVRCCGLDSTAHSEHAQHTQQRHTGDRRVVGRGRRSRGWSFRFGTLHQSCACTHRHRVWFLFRLSSQQACDFIQRRHQCICSSRGMVLVPLEGLRASPFGTASEVPPEELPTTRHLLTHLSRVVPQPTHPGSRGDILACLFRGGTKSKCMRKEVHRALVVRAMRVGCSVTFNFVHVRGVVEGGFLHTVVFCYLFHGHLQGRFTCGDTSPHNGFEINTDPRPRRRSAGHRSSARCAFGARRPRFWLE